MYQIQCIHKHITCMRQPRMLDIGSMILLY